MDLRDVAVLVEAVQSGSLAAAGRRLGLSPMAASRRLAALEAELGVRLAQRTTRALALTPEGETFLPYAQALLEAESQGRVSLHASDVQVTGLLRVTASAPFGRKVVSPLMPDFMRQHPQLRVELYLNDRVVDIVAQGIDLAIRIAPLPDSTLIARRLGDSPRALYAAPAYLAERGVPTALAELAHHDCLTSPDTTHWSFERDGRHQRQRVSGRYATDSTEAILQAGLQGLGIIMLSDWNVADLAAAGELVRIELQDARPEALGIWAVYPSARLVPPKVRVFVQALQDRLARLPAAAGDAV